MRGHAFADDAFHPYQPHADLVLDELADGSNAAVAKVIDVVGDCVTIVDLDHALDDVHEIEFGECSTREIDINVDSAVQLVTSDIAKVVSARVEEHLRNQALCAFYRLRAPLDACACGTL